MSTPAPQYGEPWIQDSEHIFDGEGNTIADLWDTRGNRIVPCVNACATMPNPEREIAAMREALKLAHEALKEDALRAFDDERPPCELKASWADRGALMHGPNNCQSFYRARKIALKQLTPYAK